MSDVQTDPQITDPNPAPVDPAPAEPAEQKVDHSWVPKRISEITAARRAAEQRAEQAEAELARYRAGQQSSSSGDPSVAPPAPSREDFDRLVNARADAIAAQRTNESTFNQRIAAINEAGTKEFGEDFDKSVQNLNMAGIGGPEFLKVLTNIKGADKLVTWLGKNENINEAVRIASLDPVQMAIEMSDLVPKAAKALSKPISKVPPPVDTVNGGGGSSDGTAPDSSDTKAWMEYRNKTARRKR